MSILASLVEAYERLSDAPAFGFSSEKIGFVISLHEDGSVANVIDLRAGEGKKRTPRPMRVPQPIKRTVAIAPNFLWDKTSYVLGVTARESKRLADEHKSFVDRHVKALEDQDDPGLKSLLRFIETWHPEQFIPPTWPDDMKDQNVVFALESDRRRDIYLHDRPAAKALWELRTPEPGDAGESICLVTGTKGPVARLHPAIKGVWGAQSSGASIVSFNLEAFTSYGHAQGDNAPISKAAAFKYTAALNAFLSGRKNRLQIGDTSTVFWAAGPKTAAAQDAESLFAAFAQPDLASETGKIDSILKRIRNGEPLQNIDPELAEGVRFHVLGLAPNAARLSVRFWFDDDFGHLAQNYQRFLSDTRIEPSPREDYPAIWRYLVETAVLGKRENIPPNLAGDWLRSILGGTPYPLTLLSTVLMRIRADKEVNGLRVAMLRALLVRNFGMDPGTQTDKSKEAPVSLDPNNTNKGYVLGRLFAAYEHVQTAALGRNVNATVKDKFYGAASAQPRKVFPLLDKGSANHLSKIGKQRPGQRVNLEKTIAGILEAMSPDADPFPASLNAQEQALFSLGYYHQRNDFFRKREPTDTGETDQ
jgi:CRISPR-associated protein Csd1